MAKLQALLFVGFARLNVNHMMALVKRGHATSLPCCIVRHSPWMVQSWCQLLTRSAPCSQEETQNAPWKCVN